MSTRSSVRNLFSPLDNPELTIRRRSRFDPTLLNNSEMAAEGPGELPVPDLWTMEELCQPSLNGRGGPIAPIAIQVTNFKLKNDMIQQVQNSCQFHSLPGGTFMKRRHEECYDLIKNMTTYHNDWDTSAQCSESSSSITSSSDTEIAALKAEMEEINKNLMRVLQLPLEILKTFMLREPIKVSTKIKTVTIKTITFRIKIGIKETIILRGTTREEINSSRTLTKIKTNLKLIKHQLIKLRFTKLRFPQPQVVTTNEFINFMKTNDAILKNMQTNMTSLTNSNLDLKNIFGQFMKMNTASSSSLGTHPGNTITNPKEDLKGITTRSGTAYPGPTIPTTSSSPVVEYETEATKDMMHPTNNGSTEDVQPLVVPTESPILTSEPVNSPIIEPAASPVSALRPNLIPSIPYPSRLQDQKLQLADRLISHPVGVAEDVFVKVGELTLRVGKEAITFNLDQTSRYSANYNDMTAKQINVIDMACEEYSQEVLSFSDVIVSSNPTPYYDPIVSTTSLTLTPFGNSDFLLEEVDAFLALEDDPTSPKVDQSYLDYEGSGENHIHCPYRTFAYRRMPFGLCNAPCTFQRCMMAIFHDMIEKTMEVFMDDFLFFGNSFQSYLSHLEKMLKRCEDTNLCLNWEKSHFMVKDDIVLGHKIFKKGIEVDKAKVDAITKLPHPTTVKVSKGHAKVCCHSPFATPYHPQTSGQVEVSNRGLKPILESAVEKNRASCELRDQAYENSLVYKEKTKRLHDSKIKDRVFNIGDRVLLFISRLKIFFGKLKSRWSGPFTISHVFPYGNVKLSQPDGPNFKVNGHRLKHYFGEDVPKMVVPNLQTFPKDH
uniref:Reverse transcriptase domain-containing protein n=1 Tax=Tanacetum cinerariifolium TaxID=118510 RepID=A0A699GG70_TANCI|nr:reverse transcriptase domain-containing protein [Tanacetum cinerariifolium]